MFPLLSEMVEYFLSEGSIDPNKATNDEDKDPPLILAAMTGNLSALRFLLSDARVDIDAVCAAGDTALILACFWNKPECAHALIQAGCNLVRCLLALLVNDVLC